MKKLLLIPLIATATSAYAAPTSAFKRTILPLVAGTYSEACFKTIDDGALMEGSAMVFSGDKVSWGEATHNLAEEYSSSFGVMVTRSSPMFAAVVDLENPSTGERTAVYGVGTSYDGEDTAATVTLNGAQKISNGCTGSKPSGSGANLWKLANEHIKFSELEVQCVNTGTGLSFSSKITFDGKFVRMGEKVFDQTGVDIDQLMVEDANEAFVFSTTKSDSGQIIIKVNAEKKLDQFIWREANGTGSVCYLNK